MSASPRARGWGRHPCSTVPPPVGDGVPAPTEGPGAAPMERRESLRHGRDTRVFLRRQHARGALSQHQVPWLPRLAIGRGSCHERRGQLAFVTNRCAACAHAVRAGPLGEPMYRTVAVKPGRNLQLFAVVQCTPWQVQQAPRTKKHHQTPPNTTKHHQAPPRTRWLSAYRRVHMPAVLDCTALPRGCIHVTQQTLLCDSARARASMLLARTASIVVCRVHKGNRLSFDFVPRRGMLIHSSQPVPATASDEACGCRPSIALAGGRHAQVLACWHRAWALCKQMLLRQCAPTSGRTHAGGMGSTARPATYGAADGGRCTLASQPCQPSLPWAAWPTAHSCFGTGTATLIIPTVVVHPSMMNRRRGPGDGRPSQGDDVLAEPAPAWLVPPPSPVAANERPSSAQQPSPCVDRCRVQREECKPTDLLSRPCFRQNLCVRTPAYVQAAAPSRTRDAHAGMTTQWKSAPEPRRGGDGGKDNRLARGPADDSFRQATMPVGRGERDAQIQGPPYSGANQPVGCVGTADFISTCRAIDPLDVVAAAGVHAERGCELVDGGRTRAGAAAFALGRRRAENDDLRRCGCTVEIAIRLHMFKGKWEGWRRGKGVEGCAEQKAHSKYNHMYSTCKHKRTCTPYVLRMYSVLIAECRQWPWHGYPFRLERKGEGVGAAIIDTVQARAGPCLHCKGMRGTQVYCASRVLPRSDASAPVSVGRCKSAERLRWTDVAAKGKLGVCEMPSQPTWPTAGPCSSHDAGRGTYSTCMERTILMVDTSKHYMYMYLLAYLHVSTLWGVTCRKSKYANSHYQRTHTVQRVLMEYGVLTGSNTYLRIAGSAADCFAHALTSTPKYELTRKVQQYRRPTPTALRTTSLLHHQHEHEHGCRHEWQPSCLPNRLTRTWASACWAPQVHAVRARAARDETKPPGGHLLQCWRGSLAVPDSRLCPFPEDLAAAPSSRRQTGLRAGGTFGTDALALASPRANEWPADGVGEGARPDGNKLGAPLPFARAAGGQGAAYHFLPARVLGRTRRCGEQVRRRRLRLPSNGRMQRDSHRRRPRRPHGRGHDHRHHAGIVSVAPLCSLLYMEVRC
ncbi:hypothetical protein RJ55_05538 [Drechmeria coniospora]|nr:hypothetical protein RJ55_05538 [Drechmeria coniospora]